MARSTPRGGRGQPARAAAKSKKAVAVEAEPAEAAPGIGIENGVAILTTVALFGALILVDMIQGKNGDGIFF
jgi:hypothetical protein